jgi:hypothetical protein
MKNMESVVAVYATHGQAEDAVKNLQEGGIDMKRSVDRCEGHPHRRACRRLLQRRRPNEALG